MESTIYPLSKLKRITSFVYPLDEIGIMVNHCAQKINHKLYRYFFCFSFNKEKYNSTQKDLRPTFAILPPGTILNNTTKTYRDELFFSYSPEQSEKFDKMFSSCDEKKYTAILQMDDDFKQNLLKVKELIVFRNNIGVIDKLDTLALQMIMTAYANSMQNNTERAFHPDARIQEIAVKLKHGEKLDILLRKYGYSRRAF